MYLNNSIICFKNVPDVSKLDNHTPLLFLDSKNIFLLEETEYQLIFTPEKSNANTVRFPKLENIDKNPILTPLNFDNNIYGGILNFKSYVGQSFFDVEVDGLKSIKIPFEVRSKKMNYENHYPSMIADLAKAASSLIFYQKSPTFKYINFQQRVKKSFYEDFMFLEYIFRPENLLSSYGYIRRDPHKILEQYIETVPTDFASSVGPEDIIHLISNPGNLTKADKTPLKWPSEMENYVPKRINQKTYEDTLDTPENRFVKYFLELLNELLTEMIIYIDSEKIEGYPAEKTREYAEIIQEYIFDGWLKEVGELYNIPSNSQVLQKKEGYRDILDYFLIFEFAFNFQCEEIKENIKGYQRKLSEIYEYWCYLQLFKILSSLSGKKADYNKLFDFNKKNWEIHLKQGKDSCIKFEIELERNTIEVELYNNLRFQEKEPINGSYSVRLRPDYSILVRTGYDQFFIHFDAKYRSKVSFISNESDNLLDNKKSHIYKNDDIYKMHTYKDAISNTKGAYVLYPGEKSETYLEKDKIIPSIGAFPLTPGKISSMHKDKIKLFIKDYLLP